MSMSDERDRLLLAHMRYLQRHVDYVRNVGGVTGIERFDDDFSPVGPELRSELVQLGFLVYNAAGDLSLPPEPLAEPKMAVKVEKL